ncbi:D-aminoacylase [bacterium]|nr:D-aminoacylase [bacterium]
MNRRLFIRKSAPGAVLTLNAFLSGCSKGAAYDLVIQGGTVYDGLGGPGIGADVAVLGDRIVKIGRSISAKRALKVIDARGLAVAPGFIDVHTHTDIHLLVNPQAESKIRQGVTTEIGGNCGGSVFPWSDKAAGENKAGLYSEYGVDADWKDVRGFFSRLEKTGMALNYATLLGHGTLRDFVMGPYDRPPTAEELEHMKQLVREHMDAGVVGLSTGLIYTPGSFAATDELVELCSEVARYGGVYATHMRDERDRVLEALQEAITVSHRSGVSLQVSHLKVMNPENWPKIDGLLDAVDSASKQGIPILADRYPYTASSTGLASFFPLWVREGTTGDFLGRLRDRSLEARLTAYIEDEGRKAGSWDNVMISSVQNSKNEGLVGSTILKAAQEAGKEPFIFMRDLLVDENGQVSVVKYVMSEDNLRRVLAHPLVVTGSDGYAIAPYGPLSKGKPHPRSYGTFPRVLGRYVRDEGVLTLPEAVRKMTSVSAAKFGLTGRGRIEEGAFADIVVFDPDTVIDLATYTDPHQYPGGIPYVIVNGREVISEGEHTGALPGKILRKTMP